MTITTDEYEYQQGQIRAASWISIGGDLWRDPPQSTEAFENGFCDALAAERQRVLNFQRRSEHEISKN